jgi:ADP-heptose:LPS heptosyltransferase
MNDPGKNRSYAKVSIQLGDIGDVVLSLPAVRAVRAAYPGATVSLLLRETLSA